MERKHICETKWAVDLELDASFDWEKDLKFKTKDTKLLWFHYRILHRILCTNKLLFMLKIRASPLSSLGNPAAEITNYPLFYRCPVVRNTLMMC